MTSTVAAPMMSSTAMISTVFTAPRMESSSISPRSTVSLDLFASTVSRFPCC